MLRAVAAINASAYMHLPESHVHDTARSRNQTIQDIGPFSVMNKTMNAPSGDRHGTFTAFKGHTCVSPAGACRVRSDSL